MPPALGWTVLGLVFLDEVLLVVASWVAATTATAAPAPARDPPHSAAWWTFASPKAPYGGRVTRPVTKILVVAAACGGLWASGHEAASLALLVFSVVVNAVALLPSVARLPGEVGG